jgi:hypothetical protein
MQFDLSKPHLPQDALRDPHKIKAAINRSPVIYFQYAQMGIRIVST